LGRLMLGEKCHLPCTPSAVMTIIEEYKIPLTGQKVCMIGRSNIVGKPLSLLLTHQHATVTLCHSRTADLKGECLSSDIVVAAIGKTRFVKGDWIKPGAVVIDVGTNYTENGLAGDVDFEAAKDIASRITPVPGGVGSLTNAILMKNCLEAYESQITRGG
ncbi:MAG: bifunctional 5,10-methylene-tetrahydrofolate dehydrogenase/5,10-methylene-tetrahydrofolate cyclohydrolase, partial [Spirochaetota bacterium]|nr:bifunctional 5,10-methylene-tetrahydrofolate dehydrogenase/5,10-methylene-tetrahydrofolate cyclohydrolase [Spirochaetota bacterium]